MKTIQYAVLGMILVAGTGSVQAMQDQPTSGQPAQSRWSRIKQAVRNVPTNVREKARTLKEGVSTRAAAASAKVASWTPEMVKNGAEKTKNFLSHKYVYYPMTALLAAGLGYKAYQVRQDEYEWTRSAIAYGLGSAVAGYAFLKEPVCCIPDTLDSIRSIWAMYRGRK